MTPKTKIESAPIASDLASKTVCLEVTFNKFGNSRRLPSRNIKVDADKKYIKATKLLLNSKELKAIGYRDNDIRTELEDLCLPYPAKSVHLVPFELVDEAADICENYQKIERPKLVETFMEALPALKEQSKINLRSNWNPKDIPTNREVRNEFEFRYRFFYYGLPSEISKINPALFKREGQKSAELWKVASDEITTVLRTKYWELINHLKKSLEPDEDGKQKKLYESSLEKFTQFFRTFDLRNVNNDEELKKEVQRAKELLSGVSIEALRTTDTLRDKISQEMESIKGNLEPLIEIIPTGRGRKFRD